MKPESIEKAVKLLTAMKEAAMTCEQAALSLGITRSTAEEHLRNLGAEVLRTGQLEGVFDRDWIRVRTMKRNAERVLEVARGLMAAGAVPRKEQVVATSWQSACERIRQRPGANRRDVALLHLLFTTGLKPREMASLRVHDYLNADGTVRELSHLPDESAAGGRGRPLSFGDSQLQLEMGRYIEERLDQGHALSGVGEYSGLLPDSKLLLDDLGRPYPTAPGKRAAAAAGYASRDLAAELRIVFRRAGLQGLTTRDARRHLAARLVESKGSPDQACAELGLSERRALRRMLRGEKNSPASNTGEMCQAGQR